MLRVTVHLELVLGPLEIKGTGTANKKGYSSYITELMSCHDVMRISTSKLITKYVAFVHSFITLTYR